MRAVTISSYGGIDALAVDELEAPSPSPGEVLVRIGAAGLNRMDTFIRQGLTGPGIRQPRRLPHVLGAEGAGVVVDASAAPDSFSPGDRVIIYPGLSCGVCPACRRGLDSRCASYGIRGEDEWGMQRDLVAVPAASLVKAPSRLTTVEAAAIAVCHTTAWTMLISAARLRVGETVLVVGSGGVAIAAMQIAAAAGARVIATSRSSTKAARLETLPFVHDVIDSSEPDWSREILARTSGTGVDIAVDSAGAPVWAEAIRSLAVGGKLCVCGATGGDRPDISIRELYQSHRQILGGPFGGWSDFTEMLAFIDTKQVTPVIDKVLPLERVGHAHDMIARDEHLGKIVLTL